MAQWLNVCNDDSAARRVAERAWPFLVPLWNGLLGQQIKILSEGMEGMEYSLFSVDGSQLYPERHQGIPCALINIGTAAFSYSKTSTAKLFSQPYLITPALGFNPDSSVEGGLLDEGFISSLRTEYELRSALEFAELNFAPFSGLNPGLNPVFFDGSLIFWHLEQGKKVTDNLFFKKYLGYFHAFEQKRILHAGYISMPKSRELVNIVRALCGGDPVALRFFTDADLVASFLEPGNRTVLFESRALIIAQYPALLQPRFFYLNVGSEIARIEIPAWIAEDEALVDRLAAILLDQCAKGRGYPVCLAEAHEQAVVKAADREFFFACMAKWLNREGAAFSSSRKSMLKKSPSI